MELIYQLAAKVIATTLDKDISTKNAFYEHLAGRSVISDEEKKVYAIVMNVQKNRSTIFKVCIE